MLAEERLQDAYRFGYLAGGSVALKEADFVSIAGTVGNRLPGFMRGQSEVSIRGLADPARGRKISAYFARESRCGIIRAWTRRMPSPC